MRDHNLRGLLSVVTCAAMLTLSACTGSGGASSAGRAAPSTSPNSDTAASASASPAFTAPAEGIVYLALGDSNVYGSPRECGGCVTYPHLLTMVLTKQTGEPVTLIDGSEHNSQTASGLLDAIQTDVWSEPGDYPIRSPLSPQEAIAAADLITITLGANMMPWYQDDDPCRKVYDQACLALIEKPSMKYFDKILAQIAKIRAGKPTAVRVTTFANDLIKGSDYDPAAFFSKGSIAEALSTARSFLDTWSSDLCALTAKRGAKCVDIYRLVAGPQGDRALPADYYTAQFGDMNQGGQDLFSAAIARSGIAPLDGGS